MRRIYRLISPALSFFGVGLVALLVAPLPSFRLHGGLAVTAAYTLALQLVLTMVLLAGIDDLSSGVGTSSPGTVRRGWRNMLDVSSRPTSFRQALIEFYRWPAVPALLLSFGVGATVSVFMAGISALGGTSDLQYASTYMQRGELLLGSILVGVAGVLWWLGGGSYIGWVIGFTAAVVVGQVQLVPVTKSYFTMIAWGAVAAGLCVARLLFQLALPLTSRITSSDRGGRIG